MASLYTGFGPSFSNAPTFWLDPDFLFEDFACIDAGRGEFCAHPPCPLLSALRLPKVEGMFKRYTLGPFSGDGLFRILNELSAQPSHNVTKLDMETFEGRFNLDTMCYSLSLLGGILMKMPTEIIQGKPSKLSLFRTVFDKRNGLLSQHRKTLTAPVIQVSQ